MNRRNYFLIVIFSILGFFLYAGACKLMGYSMLGNIKKGSDLKPVFSGHEGKLLPSIDLLLLDSITHMNVADIPSGKPIVLFSFGPYCPYCQSEIEEIVNNMRYLKDIQFYLLTSYSYSEMKEFYYKNKLEKYNNIIIGIDSKYEFNKYFNTTAIPCIAIYNNSRKLNTVYLGVIKYDQIKNVSEE